MAVREEAVLITEESIAQIIDEYDATGEVLSVRKGWYFVGEQGCDYWFAILSPTTFENTYQFDDTMLPTKLSTVTRRRAPIGVPEDSVLF